MEINDQIEFYDKRWEENTYLNSLKLRRAIKILQFFEVVKRKVKNPWAMDLGCGDGRFSAFLGEFMKTDAIELSVDAVKRASEKYPHVHFFQGNALEYPFEFGGYDLVVSQEVIEHIEDQSQYVEVCAKLLKKGGYLIITTPNKKVFDHMKGGNWSNQPIEKILTPKECKKLIREKFRIHQYDSIIMNFGHLGYFKWVNNKYLVALCNRLGLKGFREYLLSKSGYGLHQCILAQKK